MIPITCPCGEVYHGAQEHRARHMRCSRCGRVLRVGTPELDEAIQHYAAMADDDLRAAYMAGPGSYRDAEVWQFIEAEFQRRGLRTPSQEIMAIPVPDGVCHRCRRTGPVNHYDFGLARIRKTERDWTPTMAALVYSLMANIVGRALGSLFQGAALYRPVKTTRCQLLRLRLQLCPACQPLARRDYRKHPQWEAAQQNGYSHFIPGEELGRWRPEPAPKQRPGPHG